jgi:hypothetical protein
MREPFDDLLRVLVRREDGVEDFLYPKSLLGDWRRPGDGNLAPLTARLRAILNTSPDLRSPQDAASFVAGQTVRDVEPRQPPGHPVVRLGLESLRVVERAPGQVGLP